jgi:TP901 family phage tail tape measure protein
MASEVFNLAILLSLKDAASSGLDRFSAKLHAAGKDGKLFAETFDKLRADLNRDLSIGGVGIAGLMQLKKGVDEAGNLETTVLNLRQAYQEVASQSGKTREQQETDIRKIMAMATELGNQLQGNTSDYADIFTAMNKAGIDAEVTLNGAGKAAAYLANVTGAIRKGTAPQLAEDLGSYGKMFDLKGEEYMKVVELFSALEDRFNIGSGSLIEASKYFFSTAKGVMNLRGLSGAEETAKLFAFSKRYAGREGSEAGTSLDAIITQYIAHKDKIEALAKDKGIKLEFFDAKGNFQGVENMFAQLEKLKKLTPEERGIRLNAIFGEQGARIASAMVEQGVEGWRNITAEANKSVSVNEKINQQMQTYEAKTEALSGSWQNFKATAFTPLMESTKGFLDNANSIVGSLQKFSAENPGLMGTLGTIALYGSTALVVYSGFKTLTTGIRLFRLASAFSRGEGLLPYLQSTTTAATSATTALTTATAKATGFRGVMQRIAGNSTIRIGVQIGAIMGLEYAITQAIESYMAAKDSQKGAIDAGKTNYSTFQNAEKQGIKFTQKDFDSQASTTWLSVMNLGLRDTLPSEIRKKPFTGELKQSLMETVLYPWNPNKFQGGFFSSRQGNVEAYTKGFKETAGNLADPRMMSAFLRQLDTRIPNKDEQKPVLEALQKAFPDSFAAAMKELASLNLTPLTQGITDFSNQVNAQKQTLDAVNPTLQTFGQNLTDMQNPLTQANSNVTDLSNSAQKVPAPLNNVANSANNASNSLNSLSSKIENWRPPTPTVQSYTQPQGAQPQTNSANSPISLLPSRAVGGVVERDGVAMLHAGNIITPARVTKGLQISKDVFNRNLRLEDIKKMVSSASSGNHTFIYNAPPLTVINGDENSEKKFLAHLRKHEKEVERIAARRMQNGRVRA